MSKNYGTGTSRVLNAAKRQYSTVIFQDGKPPVDADFNLFQDISEANQRNVISSSTPSGWLGNGINDQEAFLTNPAWSNWFRYGQQKSGELASVQWAAVNGWLIPVAGTGTGTPPGSPDDTATWNKITLDPPPNSSGGNRVDFVFLEVWQALIPPNPGTSNKPSSSGIWQYGNVEGGFSFLADDLIDPAIGFEVTKRVQVQYRIRVVTGLVGLSGFPDGFDPAYVKGRGAASSPTTYAFTNMRSELGDPGLWRAGDGTVNSLGTVDGYTYAIPLAAVFRRNAVAWDGDPGQNLNGGLNRNPTAVDRTGATTYTAVAALSAGINASVTTFTLASSAGIPLPASPATPFLIQVGDELMTYATRTGTTLSGVTRGVLGSKAEAHATATTVVPVTGRPDGLFADQVAKTDILDLRHVVNPAGFDYNSLLKGALDQCLRGTLRSNWGRSGGGPQGSFVFYQDKVSASAAALGVTKLDSPDSIRHIWSDASVLQPIEFIAKPPAGVGASESLLVGWDMQLAATCNNTSGTANRFKPSSTITIPISQFKGTVPGSDQDQIQFPNIDGSAVPVVQMRLGTSQTNLTYGVDFTVATPDDPNDDLVISLLSTFNGSSLSAVNVPLFITFHVQYGSGRGLSRRPDSVHSVAYLNATSGTIIRQRGTPSNNIRISTAWAPLWSKFRRTHLQGNLPVTAESYIDPGSKTVILSPFRQIDLPVGSTTFTAFKNDAIHSSAGVMPNPASKWGATTDPLGLFSGQSDATPTRENTYVVIPRRLMPGWGAVYAPIRHTTQSGIYEGINFGFDAPEGDYSAGTDGRNNFIPYTGASTSYAIFSTVLLPTAGGVNTAATYNAAFSDPPISYAGMRFFTDSRGMGRKGLELPPFYGISRLFAVYEAEDYATLGSRVHPTTRVPTGSGATNLLRQDFDGPTFWIELDEDGDSTFILNADALDLTKSPNAIASFETGHYVIESSIFGFDRGAFDLDEDCRIVLVRTRPSALNAAVAPAVLTSTVTLVIPAPPQGADSVAINYSRTPYQGDAYGSQNNHLDIGQLVGPLASADAHQISTTELDQTDLSLPNQKSLEVLASQGFMTTLGTGRIAGDYVIATDTLDFRNPGYEYPSNYPPDDAGDDRPVYGVAGVLGSFDELVALGTEYGGCTSRLPLGSLYRDKDFRGEIPWGNSADQNPASPLVYADFRGPGVEATGISYRTAGELTEVPVFTTSPAAGFGGEMLVHVDGETSNLSSLENYRTTRGGSAYVVSGIHSGGELASVFTSYTSSSYGNCTLCGVAYLVRNTATSIGASEVSAGQELQMLIVTTTTRKSLTVTVPARVLCGSNGSGEGMSGAGLYRLPGHPLANDGTRFNIDLDSIVLSSKVSLKPRIGG